MKKTQVFVLSGLFISLEVILTHFLSITTPIIRIGFGFLPSSLCSIMLGPVLGGITSMLSDVIGVMLFPQGAYFPGFTISAFLSGTVYGMLLYKKKISLLRVSLAVLIVTIFIDLGLNTLWLSIITGKAVIAIIFPRLIKSLIMFPIQVFLISTINRHAYAFLHFRFSRKI